MAKRYDELAEALDELALHHRLDENGRLARDYQVTASELRTAEFIPPDPSQIDGVPRRTRDAIAEWRAFGEIEELEQFKEQRPYLTELCDIAKVGPKTAKRLNDEKGATNIEDIRQLDENGELEDVSGIGAKTATTIRRSIAQR